MLDKKVFGLRLREIREAKQISRKEVAELLHVTKTQISDMENGKSGTNLDRLYLLCNYYKVLISPFQPCVCCRIDSNFVTDYFI